jgi:hypothetical protein
VQSEVETAGEKRCDIADGHGDSTEARDWIATRSIPSGDASVEIEGGADGGGQVFIVEQQSDAGPERVLRNRDRRRPLMACPTR